MLKFFSGIFSIYFLLHPATFFAQSQPWKQLQSPVDVTLRYLSFVDSLTGWAAGEAGTIIRTTDGGDTWEVQNSTVETFISDIFFLDKDLGWATTIEDVFPFNSIIIKTTNGGEVWIAENFSDSSEYIRTIFFIDSLKGFVGGSYIGYTLDGGNSWISAEVDSNMYSDYPVYNFNFLNGQFGYACGGFFDQAGVLWRTTNSGINWFAQRVSIDVVFDVHIFDLTNAITLSGDPEERFPVSKINTTDSGLSWVSDSLSFRGLSFAIDFRTYNEGWSASGYKFLLTTNRGETWSEFETPDSTIIFDLQFTDPRNGYAVGLNGAILKFDPTLAGTETFPLNPGNFILYQNYPNPFNPATSIRYAISSRQFVTLKIYDVLGNELFTLVNEELTAGEYEVEFFVGHGSMLDIASGIYFYRLQTGSFIQTKKMIYLK
jgi:photosystem II stability/assembly factor-like uncharacterized protein